MTGNGRTPEATSTIGSRIRVHSLVISILILVITLPLIDELQSRLFAAPDPRGSAVPFGSVPPSADGTPLAPPSPTPLPTPAPDGPQVVYAAGDIADCPETVPAVADLIPDSRSLFLALGDIVYPSGASHGFTSCFDPVWGSLKSQIRPVPGNHDYQTLGAAGYFEYFGERAGRPSQGYYSFDVGWWHVIALNSECKPVGGCRERSPQTGWLRADLAAHPAQCTLAFWHHPRFSSGDGASRRRTASMWTALYDAGADLVLNGHDHDYERFAPMDPAGHLDPERGIRQFVVGTGGANLTTRDNFAANSEIWTRDYHGLLELTLGRNGYAWRFLAAGTGAVIDRGSDRCH